MSPRAAYSSPSRLYVPAEYCQSVVPVREKRGRLDLGDLLEKLASFGVARLLVEGGGELAWSLLSEGWVDRCYWILAPKVIGGRHAKTSVEGEGFDILEDAMKCQVSSCRRIGNDWLFEFEPERRRKKP